MEIWRRRVNPTIYYVWFLLLQAVRIGIRYRLCDPKPAVIVYQFEQCKFEINCVEQVNRR